MSFTQENLIKIAEDFEKWLDEASIKYGIDKMTLQELIKQFLIG